MVESDRVIYLFRDARDLYDKALDQLDRGDLRDAAEKAWRATKRATDALILARDGEEPEFTARTSRGLLQLASTDRRIETLVGRYYTRIGLLHGECFYNGMCEPEGEVERRIRETVDYIQDAENLAG